jgi:hypothetical protein
VRRGRQAELRIEAINLFNHANFVCCGGTYGNVATPGLRAKAAAISLSQAFSNRRSELRHRTRVTPEDIFAANAVNAWKLTLTRLNDKVAALTDEQMQVQIAPNRNRVIYVIGHLIAVSDRMFPLLGFGDRLYANLDEPYLTNPDGKLIDPLTVADLKKAWTEVHEKLTANIEGLSGGQWLARHTAVSEEDFAKEPSRNRMAVLQSRTSHLSFHLGQLVLVK